MADAVITYVLFLASAILLIKGTVSIVRYGFNRQGLGFALLGVLLIIFRLGLSIAV